MPSTKKTKADGSFIRHLLVGRRNDELTWNQDASDLLPQMVNSNKRKIGTDTNLAEHVEGVARLQAEVKRLRAANRRLRSEHKETAAQIDRLWEDSF